MTEHLLIGLTAIVVLGICAQLLAWKVKLPAILLLLIFGFLAGPITGFLNPYALFGELIPVIVSLSVALILFEGGLSLKYSEIDKTSTIVTKLVTLGVLISWALISASCYYILNLEFKLSLLLGAILVVTGPTVIVPLLRHVRPEERIGSILKWEGIVIDPIGASLAVLVFSALFENHSGGVLIQIVISVVKTFFIGGFLGLLGAVIIIIVLKRRLVPDYLYNPLALMIVLLMFTLSNLLQHESGLFAVTLMGVVLANQKWVNVHHIIQFKEDLRVLLISSLFIIIAADLQLDNMNYILNFNSIIFITVLILFIRPLSVFLSTINSNLNIKERIFISVIAPRGIVAAAVSSVFALKLIEMKYPGAEVIVPITFLVITSTVAIYGLSAAPIARILKLATPNPQGVLIAGAHSWAIEIAKIFQETGFKVLLIDSNRTNVKNGRQNGLNVVYKNILTEDIEDDLNLDGIGKFIALTPNDEVNSLAALRFSEIFGRSEVFQLPIIAETKKIGIDDEIPGHLKGRIIFNDDLPFLKFNSLFNSGWEIKRTQLTDEFDYETYQEHYSGNDYPLFLLKINGELSIFTIDNPPVPISGDYLISLVKT